MKCGFCSTNNHDRCVGTLVHKVDQIWTCPCTATPSCGAPRCVQCGAREHVDPVKAVCLDQDACNDQRERARRDWLHTNVGSIPERARTEHKPTVTAIKQKVGSCICCGEPTKGGLFLPGHDARWLSTQVQCWSNGGIDRLEVREYMKSRGVSDALLAKFDKRVGL